jgi:hypothetical protein
MKYRKLARDGPSVSAISMGLRYQEKALLRMGI